MITTSALQSSIKRAIYLIHSSYKALIQRTCTIILLIVRQRERESTVYFQYKIVVQLLVVVVVVALQSHFLVEVLQLDHGWFRYTSSRDNPGHMMRSPHQFFTIDDSHSCCNTIKSLLLSVIKWYGIGSWLGLIGHRPCRLSDTLNTNCQIVKLLLVTDQQD